MSLIVPFAQSTFPSGPSSSKLCEIAGAIVSERWVLWHAFAGPTFLPGLALQLPFALLAYVAARLLLRAAVRLGRLLGARPVGAFASRPAMFGNHVAGHGRGGQGSAPRAPPLAVVS